MFQLQKLPLLFCMFIFICLGMLYFGTIKVHAAEFEFYSYDKVKAGLPEKRRTDDYIYKLDNGDPCIAFATYNKNDYKTSVKKQVGKSNYIYCIDHTKHITFKKTYSEDKSFFNDELLFRLAIALECGPAKWGEKAKPEFTTNNSVLDYYMTQIVIHSLIYDYGDKKSNMGINYKLIEYNKNTPNLEKNTDAFYQFCKKADITKKNQYFKTSIFSFAKPGTKKLLLNDNNQFVSENIKCTIGANNANIRNYIREVIPSSGLKVEDVSIAETAKQYNSDFSFSISKDKIDQLGPQNFTLEVTENVLFDKEEIATWKCTDKDFKDSNQAVCGKMAVNSNVSDRLEFELLIGNAVIHKSDSITKNNISDAEFQLLQYNESSGQYEYVKNFTYNAKKEYYDSGNIYLSIHNPNGKFKVIESKSGKNYINDWEGEEFVISKDTFNYEFNVENQPILGTVKVKKVGENVSVDKDGFKKNETIPLNGIVFGLYPEEDIYINNCIFYSKDEWIANLTTDGNGEALINNLLPGKYYLKEVNVPPLYILDESPHSFEVVLDENKQENITDVTVENYLKNCEIEVYKFYYQKDNKENKLPLAGAKFGLYAKEDITDATGKILVEKDSLIKTGISDTNGFVAFKDLIYADYYLKELEAPVGYIADNSVIPVLKDNFVENIPDKKFQYKIDVENKLKNCEVKVFKYFSPKDNEEKRIPLEGAKFGLYTREDIISGDGKILLKQDSLIEEKYSDKDGMIVFSNLFYADYYLKELEAPKDFLLSDGILFISKKDFSLKKDSETEYSVQEELVNKKCLTQMKITKLGEVLSEYQKKTSNQGDYISYQCKKEPLENIIFSLYDSKQNLISSEKTNAEGVVYFNDLEPGEYFYREENCPDYYKIDDMYKLVKFEPDNKHYNESEKHIIEETAENELCNCYITINKTGEQAVVVNEQLQFNEIPLKDVVFGIFQDFDYELASGEKILKNSCVGYLVTDEKGWAGFTGKLPIGTYYIRELKTNAGYQLDENNYPFEIVSNNHKDIEINLEKSLHLINLLSKASVEINKTDVNTGKQLKNVEFTLYNENDDIIGVYKTDKNGKIIVENLPYGKYYFIETKCKNGYYSTNNKYHFILESEERITLDITNSPILKLGFAEHYKLGLVAIFILVLSLVGIGITNFKKSKR